jgi:hypothetical protein
LTPDPGTSTPVGARIFSFNLEGILLTESGIPAAQWTTRARVYVDLSAGDNTGLASANPTGMNSTILVTAFRNDGVTRIGQTQVQLDNYGHDAKFADQLIPGLPAGFTGVFELTSPTPFAALTLHSLYNERGDFLLTTFPVADQQRPAPVPIVFPQIADGGRYVTQFILLSGFGPASTAINFYGVNGDPLAVGQ